VRWNKGYCTYSQPTGLDTYSMQKDRRRYTESEYKILFLDLHRGEFGDLNGRTWALWRVFVCVCVCVCHIVCMSVCNVCLSVCSCACACVRLHIVHVCKMVSHKSHRQKELTRKTVSLIESEYENSPNILGELKYGLSSYSSQILIDRQHD